MGPLTRLQGGSLDMSLLDWLLFHFTVAENVAKKWNGRAIPYTSRYVGERKNLFK